MSVERTRTRISLLALTPLVALALAGCPSEVDQRALDGLQALDRCDVRAAHDAFADALALDASRSDVALGFALTDLATLLEDPAIAAIAPELGFDRAIDTSILWGHDGLLERLGRGDSCETIDAWRSASLPHPALRPGGPDLVATIDPALTLGDLRDTLVTLSPRLTRVARALELAAEHLEDGGVTLSGGCGLSVRPIRVQAPELLALAASFDALVAAGRDRSATPG